MEGDIGILELLPMEILLYLMSFFEVKEISVVFSISRKMNFIASHDFVWSR